MTDNSLSNGVLSKTKHAKDIFSDDDIYFAKLSKIIRTVGTRTLHKITFYLYQDHPLSKNGKLSIKEFVQEIDLKSPQMKKKFGNIFVNKFSDDYKLSLNDDDILKLDVSALFAIIDTMSKTNLNVDSFNNDIKKKEIEKLGSRNKIEKQKEIDILKTKMERCTIVESFSKKFAKVLDEIKIIKDIRNKLYHDNFFDKKFLEESKDRFLTALEVMFKELGAVNVGIKSHKDVLDEALNNSKAIWNTKLTKKDINDIIFDNNNDVVKKFIEACKKELIDKYECFKFDKLCPLLFSDKKFIDFSINEVFTPVSLYTKHKNLDYEDLLTVKSEKKTTSPRAVIISGNAGLGKTTICRKLTCDWFQDSNSASVAQDYDLVLHIEAKKARQRSLVEYLKQVLLSESMKNLQKEHILSCLMQCNVLFIIDGYDERSADASHLLEEIMLDFYNKKFIIATRPFYKKDIKISLQNNNLDYLDVTIKGFEEYNRNILIDKIWLTFKEKNFECGDAVEFKNYIEIQVLEDLLSSPLILLILIYLWVNGKKEYKSIKRITFTCLYEAIFSLMMERIMSAVKSSVCEIGLPDLEKKINLLIVDIGCQCFRLATQNKSIVDKEFVKNIKTKMKDYNLLNSDMFDNIISAFFLFYPSLQKQQASKMSQAQLADHLEFLHKTQVEYLSAVYIENEMHKTDKDNLLQEIFCENNQIEMETKFAIVSFIVGLLMNKKRDPIVKDKYLQIVIELIMPLLKSYVDKYVYSWKLLFETQSLDLELNSVFYDKTLSSALLNILSNDRLSLQNNDVVSGLNLFFHTNMKIKDLEITIDESSCSTGIQQFLNTIGNLKYYKPRLDRVNFRIHLKGDLCRGIVPNDEILGCLSPWCQLLEFTGFLGETACLTLPHFNKLKQLTVRFETQKAFTDCINSLKDMKTLKRLNLYMVINNEYTEYSSIVIHRQAKISVFFDGPKKEDLNRIASILNDLSKNQPIDTVSLEKTNLKLENFTNSELFDAVFNCVSSKLTIHSSNTENENEILKIKNKLPCKFEWL